MVKTNEPGPATRSAVATWLTVKTNEPICLFYFLIQGSGKQTRLMVVTVVPVQQQEGSIDYCRAHTMLPYIHGETELHEAASILEYPRNACAFRYTVGIQELS